MRHRQPQVPVRGCKVGTSADAVECGHNWPLYPCYNSTTRECQSITGEILVDPFNDILSLFDKIAQYIVDIIRRSFRARIHQVVRDQGDEEVDAGFVYQWSNWGSTIIRGVPFMVDIARFIDFKKLIEMEKKLNEKITTIINERLHRFQGKQDGGSMMYNYIVNPKTGKQVSIFSKTGEKILKKYINYIKRP